MPAEYDEGDVVRYKPVGGPDSKTSEAVGTIRSVATEDQNMTHRNVHASKQNPRYEIENNRTHKRSAISEANILGPGE
ncbi:DUF2945 domain-containing protein [Aspergillus chevalieri]|uniref:Hypervirulence associated protein TUDOR domain-containing protein n=1 Tax=Aspergillus chevalieri TaxID=182096 RepID=A0A7R7VJU4_ASPCH|nr:uncharacterized protein ACHE_21205A [Aspergillus chevalieri]BCR85747.1 hypothetical protein ACHE_21205A [Aspergillus chevalieri]